MGTWGISIMSDDAAADVYDAFMQHFKKVLPKAKLLSQLKHQFKHEFKDDDDGPMCHFAVAKAMWEVGWLDEVTLARVEKMIRGGRGLERWAEERPAKLAKRRAALRQFSAQLHRTNPKPKVPPKSQFASQRKALFQAGDCLALRLCDGRYAAGIVVFEEKLDPSRTVKTSGRNSVAILNWIGEDVPTAEVFESRVWLIPTHHSWSKWRPEPMRCGAPASEIKKRMSDIQVVGHTRLRSTDPRNDDGGWSWNSAFEQPLLQERWEKGIRD